MGSESETSGKQNGSSTVPKVDRTYKLYYGGAHKRPDGNSTIIVKDFEGKPYAMVADGSRKDIRNAVEAASKAQPGWNGCGSHLRSQILFYFAENLEMRSKEFAAELSRLLGRAEKDALQEIQQCIECLFFWAGVSDKNPISTCEPPPLPESKVNVFVKHDPMGVIGIVCPSSSYPLLTAVSIMAPAIALGNAVVMVPSQKCPLPALWLCQIIDTSDIPAGIINIITGNAESLGVTLASHHDVNSLWSSDIETCKNIKENFESFANHSMKPIWFWKEKDSCCWNKPRTVYHTEFYLHSTKTKAVWKPIGAIFAN